MWKFLKIIKKENSNIRPVLICQVNGCLPIKEQRSQLGKNLFEVVIEFLVSWFQEIFWYSDYLIWFIMINTCVKNKKFLLKSREIKNTNPETFWHHFCDSELLLFYCSLKIKLSQKFRRGRRKKFFFIKRRCRIKPKHFIVDWYCVFLTKCLTWWKARFCSFHWIEQWLKTKY